MSKLAVCGAVLAFASMAAFASTETDWSAKSGDVVIPAGETWYADEADMAKVNALTSITLEKTVEDDATNTATLVFRNTTTVPKASLLAGAGIVRKAGDSVWTSYVNSQAGFTGDFHLDGGVVTNAGGSKVFGDTANGVGGLWVNDGAALVLGSASVSATMLDQRALHLAGSGNGTVGYAVYFRKGGYGIVKRIVLEADAALCDGYNFWIDNGTIDLNGHELSYYGSTWHQQGLALMGLGSLSIKSGDVYARGTTSWLNPPGAGAISFDQPGNSTLTFHESKGRLERPVTINRNTYLTYSEAVNGRQMTTNEANLAGPVTLNGAGTKLVLRPLLGNGCWKSTAQVTVSGKVTGAGRVAVTTDVDETKDGKGIGRACLAAPDNDYTGGTFVNGFGNLGLLLYYPTSIPDLTETAVKRGYLAARLGETADGTPRWTESDFWEYMNTPAYSEYGHFSIDATEWTNGTYVLDPQKVADNVPDASRRMIGVCGGTLKLVAPPGESRTITVAADLGVLDLSGGGTYNLAGYNVIKGLPRLYNSANMPVAEVRVSNGSTVVQDESAFFLGGRYRESTGSWDGRSTGRLVVSNANWITTYDGQPADASGAERAKGQIWVGNENFGIFEIQKDAFVSNRVFVGGGSEGSFSEGYGAGAVYQSGGTFHLVKKGQDHLSSAIGMANYGYYEQTGGEILGAKLCYGNYNWGLISVFGGTGCFKGNASVVSGRYSQFYMTGGSWEVEDWRFAYSDGNAKYAWLTISDGGHMKVDKFYGPTIGTVQGIVNLNDGGTLEVPTLSGGRSDCTAANPYYFVNFNGGVLKSSGSASIFRQSAEKRVGAVSVFEKGVVIEASKNEVVQHPDNPFEAHVTGGIQSITLPKAVYEFSLGAPTVLIANTSGGTGIGATAVADWDPTNRVVRGVIVTSHGWGYEQGKVQVTLRFPNPYKDAKNQNDTSFTVEGAAIAVGDNTVGGLTKRGPGTFTMNATNNAWASWTKVEGGTLNLGADGAMPDGTDLTLSGGGTLNFNDRAVTVKSLTYGVGGGTLANADNVTFTSGTAKTVEITIDDIMAGKTVPFAGALDLSEVTLRVTGDVSKLDPKACSHYRNFVSADSATGVPTIVSPELPKDWEYRVTATGVSLVHRSGLVLIVR